MSVAHLDARAKATLVAALTIVALLGDLVVAGLVLTAAEALVLGSGLARKQRALLFGFAASLPLVFLLALFVGLTPFAAVGPLTFHVEGALAGAAFSLRALALGTLAWWALRTTDARHALVLLHRWPRAAVLAAGTLRFGPLVAEDLTRVREAQALRGHEVGKGWRAATDAAPLLVPLFVLTVRRGQAVDEALQAAAFGSGPRTPPAERSLPASHAALAAVAVVLAVFSVLRYGGVA